MENLFVIGMLGTQEILLIVLAIVLIFGGRKIPELMRGLGKGMKEFKDAQKDDPEKNNDKPAQ
ncbi:MAG: twin-arginine translocase TatA/TatE family subunit [Bacteroidales bacterium]|jgi:sec-independent protein translocase protein TatA|nr:twin-arginine translocase TatA/TatE family subunit [Bacteroidales bacterium]NLM93122.1 twin-arginine translocase TatA/TatE family subunit [Bacteroidales bacterium]